MRCSLVLLRSGRKVRFFFFLTNRNHQIAAFPLVEVASEQRAASSFAPDFANCSVFRAELSCTVSRGASPNARDAEQAEEENESSGEGGGRVKESTTSVSKLGDEARPRDAVVLLNNHRRNRPTTNLPRRLRPANFPRLPRSSSIFDYTQKSLPKYRQIYIPIPVLISRGFARLLLRVSRPRRSLSLIRFPLVSFPDTGWTAVTSR